VGEVDLCVPVRLCSSAHDLAATRPHRVRLRLLSRSREGVCIFDSVDVHSEQRGTAERSKSVQMGNAEVDGYPAALIT
jgi:hypothetical protein